MRFLSKYVVGFAFSMMISATAANGQTTVLSGTADSRSMLSWHCGVNSVRVFSASVVVAELACEAARVAADTLSKCRLYVLEPIDLEMSDASYLSSSGARWGEYVVETERVNVVTLATYLQRSKGMIGSVSIPKGILHASVVAHEVAHAIVYAHTKGLNLPDNAHEYIAYAVQIASLPREHREALVREATSQYSTSLFTFSFFGLRADPALYAVNAYRHFIQPENGCRFLDAVIRKEVHFPPASD